MGTMDELMIINPETYEKKFNDVAVMIESISSNLKMRERIDAIYNKYEEQCSKIAEESYFYNFSLFINADIENEKFCKRFLGVFLLVNDDIDHALKLAFIKEYPLIYQYVEKRDQPIDFSLALEFASKMGYSCNQLDMKQLEVFYASLFICKFLGKKMKQDDLFIQQKNTILVRFISALNDRERKYLKKNIPCFEKIEKDIPFNFATFDKTRMEKVTSIKKRIESRKIKLYEAHLHILFSEEENVSLIISSIRLIMESEGLSLRSFIEKYKFHEAELNELILSYFVTYKNQNIERILEFLSYGFILKILSKEYVDLKKKYLELDNLSSSICMDTLEKNQQTIHELLQSNELLKKNLDKVNTEISNLRKEYKNSLEFEIIKLRKENEILKKENQELNEKNKMLSFLQEDSFDGGNEYYEKQTDDIEIPPVKAIIFGGTDKWQRKLKNILPNSFIFQSGTKVGFDETILMNAQIIFLKSDKKMSHSVYHKISNYIKKKDIKIEYIKATNTDKVREEIACKIEALLKNDLKKAS